VHPALWQCSCEHRRHALVVSSPPEGFAGFGLLVMSTSVSSSQTRSPNSCTCPPSPPYMRPTWKYSTDDNQNRVPGLEPGGVGLWTLIGSLSMRKPRPVVPAFLWPLTLTLSRTCDNLILRCYAVGDITTFILEIPLIRSACAR
jgi:hypothetical protein